MAAAVERRRKGAGGRPFLLAAGLGLFWFAETGLGGTPIDAPALGLALVLASRLLLDLVGGWVAMSALRLVLALGRAEPIRRRLPPWHASGAAETR